MTNIDSKADDKKEQARTIIGKVVSTSMNKTAVVTIVRKIAHPVYGKFIKRTTKYYVHDENNEIKLGDIVKIQQTKPLSKLKRWVLNEVLESAAA